MRMLRRWRMCSVLNAGYQCQCGKWPYPGRWCHWVIHAIEYRTDNAVSMFGGRPPITSKLSTFVGTVCVQPLSRRSHLRRCQHQSVWWWWYICFGFDDKIYVKRLQMIPDKLLWFLITRFTVNGELLAKTNTVHGLWKGLNQSVANP